MFLGTLSGAFSRRWTAASTPPACMVENVVCPVLIAWKSVRGLTPPDLADKDVLGTLPHRSLEEVEHPDGGAEPLRDCLTRDCRNQFSVIERDLAGIFDGDDLCKRVG